jgi:DNA-binding Lrp family transcriptional regulator
MVPGWLDEMEADIVKCLGGRCRVSTAELAQALGVSEGSATRFIAMLASAGRLRIDAVSLVATPASPASVVPLSAAA